MRNVGFGTLAWVNEVSEYSLPVATLLTAPWLLHRNAACSRRCAAAHGAEGTVASARAARCDLIGLAICAVFVVVQRPADHGLASRIGAMMVKTLAIPEWWLYAPLPVAFCAACRRVLSACAPSPPSGGAHAVTRHDMAGSRRRCCFGALDGAVAGRPAGRVRILRASTSSAPGSTSAGTPAWCSWSRNGIASVTSFSLTPIPFFILMGEVLFHTGVAMKAIDAIDRADPARARAPRGGRGGRRHRVLGDLRLHHRDHRDARQPAAAADAAARLPPHHGDGADHGDRRRGHADPAFGAHRAARQPGRASRSRSS